MGIVGRGVSMPTHKDLPDSYLRGKRRRGPAGWSTDALIGLILFVGLAAGVTAGLVISNSADTAADRSPAAAARAYAYAHAERRRMRRHKRAKEVKRTPGTHTATPIAHGSPGAEAAVSQTPDRTLAIGTSIPDHGPPPD
jgi:hypothetical protein